MRRRRSEGHPVYSGKSRRKDDCRCSVETAYGFVLDKFHPEIEVEGGWAAGLVEMLTLLISLVSLKGWWCGPIYHLE